jgi:hypothetical protein
MGEKSQSHRPWLRNEIHRFAELTGTGIRFILEDREESLETHFKAITVAIELEICDI